jgi:hypothetical protein
VFKTIQKTWPEDKDQPPRQRRLQMRRLVLDGEIYDQLKHAFHYEVTDGGEYVPLRQRRPCVRQNLCRTVVDDSVSLLFSEGNFPSVEIEDEDQKKAMRRLIKEMSLNEVMIDAATRGSVGSVAILFQVLENRPFLKVMSTEQLTPTWSRTAPDTLQLVTEKYKVSGRDLESAGYPMLADERSTTFWFQRQWDDVSEVWFDPWKVADDAKTVPSIDKDRTVKHALGFVPIAWIKNLPGGDDADGKPTFQDEVIDAQIEIDYQLSQSGRGLKFMSDPTLVIKEGTIAPGGQTVKGAANAIKVGTDGDAKLLEIDGGGASAVIAYVSHLREVALETMHGNRASNEKMSAAQSGRALELLNQALIWLADRLRISYGEGAILNLMSMIVRASSKMSLTFKDGTKVGEFDASKPLTLRWPKWFAPTLQDMMNRANTLRTLCDAGLMSRETAIRVLAEEYDIEDTAAEKLLADADMAERNANAQIKAQINE